MGVRSQTTEWDGAQVAGDCAEAWVVGVGVRLSKSLYQNGCADALLLATITMLLTVHLVIFFAYQLGFDFSFIQTNLPLAATVKLVPLIALAYEFVELQKGHLHASKFLAETTLFTYVYLVITMCVLIVSWKKNALLHNESINRGAFYWFLFILCFAITLLFFPAQIWGPHSMAFRWAVESEARLLLLASLVVGSHLFTFFMSDLVRIYLNGKERANL
jgi:hypothetical protein